MLKTKLVGGEALLKKLRAASKQADEVFSDLVVETAEHAAEVAKRQAQSKVKIGTGQLIQSIGFQVTSPHKAIVYAGANYAGYVEFGTGKRVSVPSEFNEIASKIRSRPKTYAKGAGLRAIQDWCKRLGIEEKYAWPIFMSILRRGLRPRPFMYPAYLSARKFMGKRAAEKLKEFNQTLKR